MRTKRILEPGSWPWLLRHELRLLWRSFGIRSKIIAALGVLFLLLAHVAGYVMARTHALQVLLDRAPAAAIIITLSVLLIVVSSAFGLVVRVLLERGDLDLLLPSPVPMRTIYTVRGITVAAASVGSMGLFVLPFANMGPFAGQWRALAAWPALASVGLAAAAIALAATLLLVGWLGVRRARVASQILGALVGVGFVMAMQLQALLPAVQRRALEASVREAAHGRWLSSESPLLWPLRAFIGDGLPLAAMLAIGLGSFIAVILATQGAFLRAVQDAPAAATSRKIRAGAAPRAFRSGLARVVIAKELKLIARDPALLARALLQLAYLVPLFIVMVQRGRSGPLIAAGLVVLAAGLASTLAWIAVSGEEAPELVRSAPVAVDRVRWLKVAAALLPIAVLCTPFMLWLARESLADAAIAVLFVGLALASSAVVQVWSTPLGAGRDLRQRYRQNPFVGIVETLCSFAWAGACWLALAGSPWSVPAAFAGLIAPAAAWFAGRGARD